MKDIGLMLARLRQLVEDAKCISPEVKAELAVGGEVVSLSGCSVDGAGACDAGIELARWLLGRADSDTYHEKLREVFVQFAVDDKEKPAIAAFQAVKSLSLRELKRLKKRMELEWGTARQNRLAGGKTGPLPKDKGKRRKRKRNDPTAVEQRKQQSKREKVDAEIFREWRGQEWESYQDFVDLKNGNSPEDSPKLTARDVKLTIDRYSKRLKRLVKRPPDTVGR